MYGLQGLWQLSFNCFALSFEVKEVIMAANTLVPTRIDAEVRDRATAVLEGMGLTVMPSVSCSRGPPMKARCHLRSSRTARRMTLVLAVSRPIVTEGAIRILRVLHGAQKWPHELPED